MFLQCDVTWLEDLSGNCHWFAFGVWDAYAVEMLLKGYEQVSEPRPGDVVVYLSNFGRVLHSGIVADDGLLLSKWGNSPPILHDVRTCPYWPAEVRYYRANA